ncbi:MAG: response regulator [bacterium]|jgi:CheY-like chemotaxis protein
MQSNQNSTTGPGRRPYDRESNVLIVDDDSTLLKFFKIHLNKFFSRVVVVESAKAAIETMKEREIDLVLTDVRMPKIDGLELMLKIRKQYPSIPILLISGEPMSDDQAEIVKTADGFLAKPFGIDELNNYICSGIDLRNSMKELIACMKNPKKIREAINAKGSNLGKFVDKTSFEVAKAAHGRIQEFQKKAG